MRPIKVLGIGALCSFIISVCADETKSVMTDGKAGVISQLRGLMQPSAGLKEEVATTEDKPYLQVIRGGDNRSTLVYRCRNTKSKSIIDSIESVISRSGTVEESKDENMLVINDTSEKVEEVRQVIAALDVTVPQVLVEAKVIEVYTQDQLEKEIEWDYNKGTRLDGGQEGITSFPAAATQPAVFDFSPFSAGISGSYHRLHYFMKWLQTVNDAKILSSPNLTVSLGSTASIVTGEDLPIQSTSTTGSTVNTDIKYKRTGIQLQVTPIRINSNSVRLSVTPEVSTVTRYENFNETRTPVVSIRNVKTELSVRDGEIIMLGGLYSSEELNNEKKVPFLGDIPFLGWLFTSVDKSTVLKQLVFFLKVTIIDKSSDTFVDLERNATELREASEIMKNSAELYPTKKNLEKKSAEGNDEKPAVEVK